MSNIVPIDQAAQNLPLAMRQRVQQGLATNVNFTEGVRDAFPLLSIKGKVFRARISGNETPFIDPQSRQAIASLDVILVNASKTLAKTYFIGEYTDGDLNPPDCWSLDSVRPDASVANKVSISCISCPMNAFGSGRPGASGKATKACQDARRVAIVLPHMLNQPEPMVMMLRVPQSSLKNLKMFAQTLERHGIDPSGVITRLSFDYQEAYPKLLFNFVNVLDELTYQKIIELSEGTLVLSMLQAPDFDNAPSTQPQQNPQTGPILQPLTPQAGPVLADPNIAQQQPVQGAPATVAPVQATQVQPTPTAVQRAPVQVAQPAQPMGLIALPDGKFFDPSTGQYVEGPSEPEPEIDPNIIALPDGKFFNRVSQKFVVSAEVGAAEIAVGQAPVAAAAAARKRTAPKKPAAQQGAAAAQQQAPQTQQTPQSVNPAEVNQQALSTPAEQLTNVPVDNVQTAQPGAVDAHAGAAVVAAPAQLETILSKLLPPTSTQQ